MKTVKATCKKCGGTMTLQIGEYTREEVESLLKRDKTFHCNAGNHLELGCALDYLTIDWDNAVEANPVTDETFLAGLKDQFEEVLDTDEINVYYSIEGFFAGLCFAKEKASGRDEVFNFKSNPSGKRYYFARKRG